MTGRGGSLAVMGCLLMMGAACSPAPPEEGAGPGRAERGPAGASTSTAAPLADRVRVVVAVERRVRDSATEGFVAVVRETLTDRRGWQGAGFEFVFADDAPYRVVLAEGPEVDRLCRPYDTGGRFSCQNGPVVALNAERWRHATPQWTGDLDSYRRMLVNHEVGHLLGQHHPAVQCPRPGRPAPVMAQQSTELDGCRPNAWPLVWELECAARHEEPIAPGYEADPRSACQDEAANRS